MTNTRLWSDITIAAIAVLSAGLLLRPKLIRWPLWRATVTPLASIIGSGFLVAGPILAPIAGRYAVLAMLALCATGYLFGSAIRYNIRNVEASGRDTTTRFETLTERTSDFALVLAYFISVTYYLNLFASFGLRAIGIINPDSTRAVATAVILLVGLIGTFRGLRALENVEAWSVGLKLALITGLIAGLLLWTGDAAISGNYALPDITPPLTRENIGILLGLVILVQGFETSRYLGEAYDRETRVKTMRWAQLISSAIYIVFILLITPFFNADSPVHGRETEIIDFLKPVGAIVAPLIIFTALASQLSAAIADMNGAGGLLADATRHKVSVKLGYLVTTLVACAVTWEASILEIITYASKAFVAYYGLQATLALSHTLRRRNGRYIVRASFLAFAVILAVTVLVFGIPADA